MRKEACVQVKEKKPFPAEKKWLIGLSVALVFAIGLIIFLGGSPKGEYEQESSKTTGENLAKELVMSVIEDTAKSIKDELELAIRDMLDEDPESARRRVDAISKDIKSLRKSLEQGTALLKVASPSKAKRLEDAQVLLDVADMGLQEIMIPAIDLMEVYPISALKVGDGFNTRLLGTYIDFAESIMPKVEEILERVNAVDLSFLGNSMAEYLTYLEFANKAMEFYREDPTVLPMMKAMLGAEEDRLYVIAVQNPAEIRASGGFPGSVGTVRITDGVLTLGDFSSVANMFLPNTPKGIRITGEEHALFHYMSGIKVPRDSDLCPDFERVGHIWALAYEQKKHEPVNGVITVTPHIVQRLLKVMGEEIVLSDGTVFNGDNALKVLIHDIYFKYFSRDNPVKDRGEISDALFAEAAKKTMEKLTGSNSISQLVKYLPVVKRSIEDRTLMMWMKDEREQAFIVRMGCHGGLNQDPDNPEAGVYFNLVLASKMGWYVLMDTDAGERVRNEDGSYTYPVTVTIVNVANTEEINKATNYISGGRNGSIYGVAYFFAPAGGTVSDFSASNGQTVQKKTYHGLDLGYMRQFNMKPDTPVTITYLVTTAPGVETPLRFSKTPTAQDYYSYYGVG